MEKFIKNNVHLFVIAAILLAGFAIWKIRKNSVENETPAEA